MILIPILRKNLTYNASYQRIRCSLYLRLFSISKKPELVTSPVILDLLLNKHQFSPQVATKVASVLNRVRDSRKSDSILSFLKDSGFSNAQLEKIVKHRPQFLLGSLERTFKNKIRAFHELGFCSNDIAQIMSSNPTIFRRKFNTSVVPSLSVLKNLLGTDDAVVKLLRKFSWFLHCDLERTLVPNVEFLKSCGVSMECIFRLLHCAPFSLLLKPEVVRKSVEKAERMGANRSSKMFIYAVQACSSSDVTWELKLQAFRNCGFSESDMKAMFGKSPLTFALSAEKLKRTIDALLATGKYSMSCIVYNPASLAHSIEKRYSPRFQILEILERKNLIANWPTLGMIYRMTDKMFFEKFVGPYLSEIGELYIAKSFAMAKKDDEQKTVP